MNKYNTVSQVENALGITDWRNLSKDKVIKFAAMMPDMDNEIRLKLIERFPDFAKFVVQALGQMQETVQSTMDHNSVDYQVALNIISESQKIIGNQLERDDLSEELRLKLLDYLMELTKMIPNLDKENKKFLSRINKEAVYGTLTAIGLGIVFVGGQLLLNGLGSDGQNDSIAEDAIDVDSNEV